MIDPNLFKPAVQKVRFIHRPKFYLARLQLQGVMYPIKSGGQFARYSDALTFAERVHQRWIRLYAAAVRSAQHEVQS